MRTTTTFFFKMLLLAFLGTVTLSCEDDLPTLDRSFYGPKSQLGHGSVRTFVQFEEYGQPSSIGVVFSEKALSGLPQEMEHIQLQFPSQIGFTPFDHVGFDWNPQGHGPEGIYDLQHFDIHFYMMTSEERMQIVGGDNDPLSEKTPEVKYMPANYIALPGSVPMMGKHWIDPASPELNGEIFTQTFLMGSYNEKVTFYEPMITIDYLKQKRKEVIDLALPEAYQQEGMYYPTQYSISYHSGKKEFTVSLTGFVKR